MSLKPLPKSSVLGSNQQNSVMLSGKHFGTSANINGRTNIHNQQTSLVQSANQKRVQSTAPRLFSYKPQINEIGKSPFLQPIVSQKQIKQPVQVGSTPGTGQNGKQVMASILKHQQQTPIATGPHMMKQQQQAQALFNARLNHSSQQQQQLKVLPAPLPKFLAMKNENQQHQPQIVQQFQAAASSALDTQKQQSSMFGIGASSNISQSPRQNSHHQQLSLLAASIQVQMANTDSRQNLAAAQNSGRIIEAEHIGPNGSSSIDYNNLYNDSMMLVSGASKPHQEVPGFAQTLPTSLAQQRAAVYGSNVQPPQGSSHSKNSSPMVSYLMHLHQHGGHTQKRPNNEPLHTHGHHAQQTSQHTLHRSSSNFIHKNVNGVRKQDQQRAQDAGNGTSHHFLMMDNHTGVYDSGNQGSMYSKQPSMMVLGQSPSSSRLNNNNNSGSDGGRQNGTNVRLNNGSGVDVMSNKQNPVVLMSQPGNYAQSDNRQNLAQLVQSYNNSMLGQPVQAGPNSYHKMFDSVSKSPGQNFDKYLQYIDEDDQGIDERYDGNESGDSCGEYDENDEFTSPRAAKPKPLDQTFMPEKGQKYFSVTIGYPGMRRALRAQGWIEVKCYRKIQQIAGYTSSPGTKGGIGLESTVNRQFDNNLDLKFVLSAQDANHQNLKPDCLMNQNRGEGNLTCKSGLKESLFRNYISMANWYPMEHCDPLGLGPEAFFPRQHVVNSAEALQEFQRDFVITEAENYLRSFIKKLRDFKEKAMKQAAKPAAVQSRIQTPSNPTRTPSKARNSNRKKPSNQHISDQSPPVKESNKMPQTSEEVNSQSKSPQVDLNSLATRPYSLQDLGFLKEKLLICCNIVRKRMKCVEDNLDKKKGIRTDRTTRGTILVEERSFLLRNPKTISQAYLKYISKEEWYQKAINRFPEFKKDKNLSAQVQQTSMCDNIAKICEELLNKLRQQYPQTDMNGFSNLWIVKPGGLSRGRKIRLFKDFQKILEYAEVDPAQQLQATVGLASANNPNGPNTQFYMNHMKPVGDDQQAYSKKTWVIQKYIENPMLILNRKFDIRVWVVISSWNPLRIYVFNECYLRFSCNDYDPRCPENLFSHLTNNAVVKKCIERPDNQKTLNKIPGNMWSLDQFKEYLGGKRVKHGKPTKRLVREVNSSQSAKRPKTATSSQQLNESPEFVKSKAGGLAGGEGTAEGRSEFLESGQKIWDTEWYPQAKEIIVQSMLSAWDKIEWRKGGIGIYGFDLFPDVKGKLWLLEINKCPTMEYSTTVTRKLVPMFLDQLTELITDKRKGDHPMVGNLERIYQLPKLRDLSEYHQTHKSLVVEAKGIDHINKQSYLGPLYRNKRQNNPNPPGHKGQIHKHNQ